MLRNGVRLLEKRKSSKTVSFKLNDEVRAFFYLFTFNFFEANAKFRREY